MSTPQVKAVEAFLTALHAKDMDALAEATALRAPTEAKGESHKKLFQGVRDNSVSDDEMDQLVKAFEGYEVGDMHFGRSTGQATVVLFKPHGDRTLSRAVIVRKEKAGWKVLDYEAPRVYDRRLR